MKKKNKNKTKIKADVFLRTKHGRAALAVTLLVVFFLGYSLTAATVVRRCDAGLITSWPLGFTNLLGDDAFSTTDIPCPAPCTGALTLCTVPLQATLFRKGISIALLSSLKPVSANVRSYIGDTLVDSIVVAIYEALHQTELNLIDWWDTFWFYNLYPAMQDMTKQLHVSMMDQIRLQYSGEDAKSGAEVNKAREEHRARTVAMFAPSEGAAVMGTLMGGQQRAIAIHTAAAQAWQDESFAMGTNKIAPTAVVPTPSFGDPLRVIVPSREGGTPTQPAQPATPESIFRPAIRGTVATGQQAPGTDGARVTTSVLNAHRSNQERFERLFCDPSSNGGMNAEMCTGDVHPSHFNADTQFTKHVLNALTIDLANSSTEEREENEPQPLPMEFIPVLLENLIGRSTADPIPEALLAGYRGQQKLLERRSYLSRYAAVRSVPQSLIRARLPGTQMSEWVRELAQFAGVPLTDVSGNPSYKEVLYALTVYRFGSGSYGMSLKLGDIDKEKLIMNTLFLMQLRDYYELLEKTALTLAVQVSLMAQEATLPEVSARGL